MREEDLVKNVAKRKVINLNIKVIYNLTRKGELELVYALLALAEFYLNKGLIESSIRTLQEARQFRNFGDAGYLLGTAYLKKELKEEAMHWL